MDMTRRLTHEQEYADGGTRKSRSDQGAERSKSGTGSYDVFVYENVQGRTQERTLLQKGSILSFAWSDECETQMWTEDKWRHGLQMLCRALRSYADAHNGAEYPYLTPYTILQCDNGLYLLAMDSERNKQVVRWMQEEKISILYFRPVSRLRLMGFPAQLYRISALLEELSEQTRGGISPQRRGRLRKLAALLKEDLGETCTDYDRLEKMIGRAFSGISPIGTIRAAVQFVRGGNTKRKLCVAGGAVTVCILIFAACVLFLNRGHTGRQTRSHKMEEQRAEATASSGVSDHSGTEIPGGDHSEGDHSERDHEEVKRFSREKLERLYEDTTEQMQLWLANDIKSDGNMESVFWMQEATAGWMAACAAQCEKKTEYIRAAQLYEIAARMSKEPVDRQTFGVRALELFYEQEEYEAAELCALHMLRCMDEPKERIEEELRRIRSAMETVPGTAEGAGADTKPSADKQGADAKSMEAEKQGDGAKSMETDKQGDGAKAPETNKQGVDSKPSE